MGLAAAAEPPPFGSVWLDAGNGIHNTRNQERETILDPSNVSRLETKWVFETAGSVSATPAVDEHSVYVPDWGGRIHRVDRATGARVWSKAVSEITGVARNLSRTTPAVAGGKLVFGDQGGYLRKGARVIALDKATGGLLWSKQVDSHLSALITQSAVVHEGRVYVRRRSLYVTTGNNYTVPGSVAACVEGRRTGHGRERRRVRWIDGAAARPPDDVRAECGEGKNPLEVRERRIGQLGSGGRGWRRLLGLGLPSIQGRVAKQQALRVRAPDGMIIRDGRNSPDGQVGSAPLLPRPWRS